MSSIIRTGGSNIDRSAELRGLSTDTKPTRANGNEVPHGSTWYNMDDSTKYMYNADNDTWYNIPNGGGGGTGDMQKSVYDPTNTVANAGGIDTYVETEIGDAKEEIINEVSGNIAVTANNLIKDTVGWNNKNLLPITLSSLQEINTNGTWDDNVYTYRNITITVETDIYNLITDIKVNGANTAGSVAFKLTNNFVYQLLSEDKYYISDGVDVTAIVDGSAYISVERKKGESGETHYLSTNNENRSTKFTVDYATYDYYAVSIYIPNNSSINNAVFYPMIRRASISDATYEPYRSTVEDELNSIDSAIGTLNANLGIANSRITNLQNNKANISDLGTSAYKDSTSVVTDSSDLVESGAVYDALGFGTKNKLDAKDVYNMLAGNFVPDTPVNFPAGKYTLSFTVSGTINSGSAYQPIDMSTGTQKILVTRPLSVGRNTVTFTTDTAITRFRVFSNTPNPLNFTDIQLESGDTATSYEPYHESVSDSLDTKMSYADNGVLGAKNLLPMTIADIKESNILGTWNGNVYTYAGMTFTILTDSDNNVIGIQVTGTNTSSGGIYFAIIRSYHWDRDLIISGCPTGGSSSTFGLGQSGGAWDYGSESRSNNNKTGRIAIWINQDYAVSGSLTFRPMIRLASDTDQTYQPYAQTNRELTVNKADKSDLGTSAYKNSTSVVTDSTDLVESEAVKDIVGWGNKNLFDDSNLTLNGFTYVNGIFTNSIVDSRNYFSFRVQALNQSTLVATSTLVEINSSGRYAVQITINSAITELRIKHNGASNDIIIVMPFTLQGTFTVSLDVIGYNPTTVGGLSFKNVQVEKGSTATAYEPYHASVEEYCASKQDVYDIVGWSNKNIGVWHNVSLSGDATVGYKLNAGGSSLIAKVANNTDYTVSKKSGQGNRFRINGFTNEPSSVATLNAVQLYSNNSANEYTVNSGSYNYLVFTFESSSTIPQDTAEAMIEEGSSKTVYEPYHASVEQTLRDAEVVQGKNLNGTKYADTSTNGITFTVQDNGSIKMNGTATADAMIGASSSDVFVAEKTTQVILNGLNSGNSNINLFPWDNTDNARPYTDSTKTTRLSSTDNIYNGNEISFYMIEGHEYRVTFRAYLGATANNIVAYPMIRKASETDPTYEPYYVPLKDVVPTKLSYADNAVLGAKNFWRGYITPNPAAGVTYTQNADKSISTSGTATGGESFGRLMPNSDFIAFINANKGKTFVLNGCPSGGSSVTYYIGIWADNGLVVWDNGSGATFTIPSSNCTSANIAIHIKDGVNVSDKTWKPMLSFDGGEYVPPALTNRELTINKCDNSVIAPTENGSTASQAYAVGSHFIRNKAFCTVTSAISENESLVGSSKFTSGDVAAAIKDLIVGVSDSQTVSISSPNGYGTVEISFTVPTGYKYLCTVIDRIGATDSVNNITVFLPINNTENVARYRVVSSTVQDLTVYVTKLYIKI